LLFLKLEKNGNDVESNNRRCGRAIIWKELEKKPNERRSDRNDEKKLDAQ
jgi:hypothetical protein